MSSLGIFSVSARSPTAQAIIWLEVPDRQLIVFQTASVACGSIMEWLWSGVE